MVLLAPGTGLGQDQSESDLAKQAQNPIANMISLPFQNNTNFGIGPDNDEVQNVLNIQPVIPFTINDNWNLITRTIVPIISQPDFYTGGDGRITGLGDITFSAFFSPKDSAKFTWGVGPIFLFPTATDGPLGGISEDGGESLGSDKWGAGLSGIGLMMPGQWVIGSLFSNVWSFAGSGDQDINLFTWQYFLNYNLPKGWYLTSAPIITANWEADSDNTWTIPFGGGFGKIFKIGKQPINGQVQAFYNVEKPENGPDWQLRLQLQFLFPK
ncbi:MAG: neuromedin U [Deltaproteobacteria bacterium]|nr:neuromedin U [Deltaproteobacteria bacterium]